MPRSFLVKKPQNGSRKAPYGGLKPLAGDATCNTDADSDVAPRHRHPGSSPQLQHTAQSFSSCCSYPLPVSPHTSFVYPCSETCTRCSGDAYKLERCCTDLDMDIQCVTRSPRRTESLLPPSIPLLALFPAAPSGSSRSEPTDCWDCHKKYLSICGVPEQKQLCCEWSSKKCFSCKFCEKQYSSLGALKMHIRTHTLPCVCQLCGKAFSRPWLLQGHVRTHTGEKPFSCLHCSRAFADRSNLRAHLQTHSEVKKYQCARCCKTFSRISLLAKHQEAGCPLS